MAVPGGWSAEAGASMLREEEEKGSRSCQGEERHPSPWTEAVAVAGRRRALSGEQHAALTSKVRMIGSSPRVRGTDVRQTEPAVCARFIPACAGNRVQKPLRQETLSVHPRVCGEQSPSMNGTCPISGSSPRVRGTDDQRWQTWAVRRFIPACAGNSRDRHQSVP